MRTAEELESVIREAVLEYSRLRNYNPVDAVDDIIAPISVEWLKSNMRECSRCPLQCNKRTTIAAEGTEPILIVGDGMHVSQLSQKEQTLLPYEGMERESEIITRLFEALNVNCSSIAFMNAVNCPSFRKSGEKMTARPPRTSELDACSGFLRYAIRGLKPLRILFLGSVALSSLNRELNVRNIHGQWIEVMGIKSMATYSPSMIAQMEQEKNGLVEEYKLNLQDDFIKFFDETAKAFPDWGILQQNAS